MSSWKEAGEWIANNAGAGAALVGSLLTGNAPGAVAAGIALVSSATGTSDPTAALQSLQSDPSTMVRLRELANQEQASIRQHLQEMARLELEGFKEGQATIRNGDNADSLVVRATRPGQAWVSLAAAICYVFTSDAPDLYVLGLLLTLPFTYAGLREVGKGITAFTQAKVNK